jgi:hypothetical protein
VIAAYWLEGDAEAARALLHEKFAKLGIKRRFESLWRNMNAGQDVTPNAWPASSSRRYGRYNLIPVFQPRPRSGVGGLDVRPKKIHKK